MKLEYRSKNELVYQRLRTAIIHGEYQPGTRLVIDQLAAELGVSQIPIREAIRQLESDGFVTFEPYAGATVTEITAGFIFEVFALLESVEVICSRAACRLMTDQELEKLGNLVQHMEASTSDPEKWSQENKELHHLISEYSRSSLVKQVQHKVLDHWDRLRLHYLKDVFGNRIKSAQQEHQAILAAFRARNPDEVERLVREHNQNALTSYIGYLRLSGQLAEAEVT